MNLFDFVKQEFHQTTASVSGFTAAAFAPLSTWIERIVIGLAVGVGTWCITRSISWAFAKLKKAKCDCDNCKDK